MDYHARFYSPSLGRFTQPDTVIPGATNTQSWNRFSYVNNSPILYNDPTGHVPCSDDGDDSFYLPGPGDNGGGVGGNGGRGGRSGDPGIVPILIQT